MSSAPNRDTTNSALRQEVAELRARLEEADDVLGAIRSGAVGAIAVDTPAGKRVFTPKGVEQPYRVMVESMSEGAATVTPEGVVLYCNQRFADMLKAPLPTIVGSSLPARFAGDDAAKIAATISAGAAKISRMQARLLASDATLVPVSVAMRGRSDGAIRSVAIVVTDLTDLTRTEDEVRRLNAELEQRVVERTAQLEAANKELEAFSYSVSHDLRTPLRAIDGFSRILLEDYADKLDDEGKRVLNVVRNSTVKMANLIDDILAFSRIGRVDMNPAPVDMEALVRATVAAPLAPALAGRKVAIDIGKLPPAEGDRAMFERVWTNLLDNAIKFTGPKPEARIEIAAKAGDGETVYRVRDNGVGFDMQYVDKLFGVFQRLHGAEFPGTGIGLAIVKRIVARHGGRVWAEGKPGEGATFYFALPTTETSHA